LLLVTGAAGQLVLTVKGLSEPTKVEEAVPEKPNSCLSDVNVS